MSSRYQPVSRTFGHLNNIITLCDIVNSIFNVTFFIVILALMTIHVTGYPVTLVIVLRNIHEIAKEDDAMWCKSLLTACHSDQDSAIA